MSAMDYTADEGNDARRDMMALVRSQHEDDAEAADAILNGAGERGLKVLAELLAHAFYGMLAQRTFAVSMLPKDKAAIMDTTPIGDILSDPQLREAVRVSLATSQSGALSDD
jgi:hypothetical protein